MRKYFNKCLIITALLTCAHANANKAWCSGKVTDLQIDKNSTMYVSFSGEGTTPLSVKNGTICKLNGQTTDKEYCQGLYSSLLVAMTAQKTVTLWFNNSGGVCPSGSWVNLLSKGLYHFRIKA